MPTSYLSSASSSLSTLLTTTTSKYTTLRRQLLPLSSDERDGDTDDDTHVCRVLRAYYTEKSKPFPTWLPPDPRRPNSGGGAQGYGASGGSWNSSASGSGAYGAQAAGMQQRPTSGGSRGLSDLFGPSQSATPTPVGSLRRSEGSALRVAGAPAQPQGQGQGQLYPTTSAQGTRPPTSPISAPTGTAVRQTGGNSYLSPNATPAGARPLPSQREGSYQSLRLGRQASPQVAGQGEEYGGNGQAGQTQTPQQQQPMMGGNTAQDRLKAKLWGGSGGKRG